MDVIAFLQDLLSQVPTALQPVVVAAAGAVPFVEGEGGVAVGVLGGLHPVLAGTAAALGNLLAVVVVVLAGARARRAVSARSRSRAGEPALSGAGSSVGSSAPADERPVPGVDEGRRTAARRARFQKAYTRYGVPGVSLLGPLLLPTHFTAAMLAASGVGVARVLVWQAVAIAAWTTLTALVITGVLVVVG